MAAEQPTMPPPPYPYDDEQPNHHLNRQQQQKRNNQQPTSEEGGGDNELCKKTWEQVLQDGATIELRSLDTLRFGRGPQAVEFTFRQKLPKLEPHDQRKNKLLHEKRSNSLVSKRRCSLDQSDVSLPVVGNRIHPRAHVNRFARPVQNYQHTRLCHIQQQSKYNFQQLPNGVTMLRRSLSTSRIIAIGDGDHEEEEEDSRTDDEDNNQPYRHKRECILPSTITMSSLPPVVLSNQRRQIKPLSAAEVTLTETTSDNAASLTNASTKTTVVENIADENNLADLPKITQNIGQQTKRKKQANFNAATKLCPPHAHLNEIVYNTFFRVCTKEMEDLNKRLSNLPARDYSDIFGEMNKILHEPFSFRLMEVNTKCSTLFEQQTSIFNKNSKNTKNNSRISSPSTFSTPAAFPVQIDREQLYVQFDHFLAQKIHPIAKAIDPFMAILRESAAMARESVRACSVFSQWSREFGDQLQLQPEWELMLYKVRDLPIRFREQGLSKHWLPSSLMPLLEVLVFERKNWAEEQQHREKELAEQVEKARIAQLEAEVDKLKERSKLMHHSSSIPRIELPIPVTQTVTSNNNNADGAAEQSSLSSAASGRRRRPRSAGLLQMENSTNHSINFDQQKQQQNGAGEKEEIENEEEQFEQAEEDYAGDGGSKESDGGELGEGQPNPDEEEQGKETEKQQHNDDEDVGEEQELAQEEDEIDPIERAKAVHTAIQHLNQVYDELCHERVAKSRMNSPAADGSDTCNRFVFSPSPWQFPLEHVESEENAAEETNKENSVEDEEEQRQKVHFALLHLNNIYHDLDEQRRKSQSTVNDEEEVEEIEVKTEQEIEAKKPAEEHLEAGDGKDAEKKRPTADDEDEQREFERIEQELMCDPRDKSNTTEGHLNLPEEKDGKESEHGETPPENSSASGKAVEFWELVQRMAGMLNVELPAELVNQQHFSSRPQSAGELDARQIAVESILERLTTMLAELRRIQQNAAAGSPSGRTKTDKKRRRHWKSEEDSGMNLREQTSGSSSTGMEERKESGESAI